MKRMGHLAVLLGCVWLTNGSVARAQSRLMGDDYTYSATNFPGDIGVTEDPVARSTTHADGQRNAAGHSDV